MKRHWSNSTFPNLSSLTILLIMATIFTLIQVSAVHSQTNLRHRTNPLNGLFYPNSSEQFFKEGREKLEEEIERLQIQGMPSDELLQIKESVMSPQEVQTWCVDSEGNILLRGSSEPQVIPQKPDPVIPSCY